LTEQQPKQEDISNTKIDYNNCIMVDWILFRSCIVHREPAPDRGVSCSGSQLSVISWHLNRPLNLTLLWPYH